MMVLWCCGDAGKTVMRLGGGGGVVVGGARSFKTPHQPKLISLLPSSSLFSVNICVASVFLFVVPLRCVIGANVLLVQRDDAGR